ncbi:hypothetical protein [Streptomyces sp. NPDC096339]
MNTVRVADAVRVVPETVVLQEPVARLDMSDFEVATYSPTG